MAEKRRLRLREVTFRLAAIAALMLSVYNPSGLHLVALLGMAGIGIWPKLLLVATYLALFLALVRQTWCGLRPFGRLVPFLLVATGILLWDHSAPLWASLGTALAALAVLVCVLLTLGQVAAYYIRQASGQQLVLKVPP